MITSRTTTMRGTGLWGYHQCDFSLRTVTRTWATRDGSASRTAVNYELDFILDGNDDPRADRVRSYASERDREAFIGSNLSEIAWLPAGTDEGPSDEGYGSSLAGQVVSSVEVGAEFCSPKFEGDGPAWLHLATLPVVVTGTKQLHHGGAGYWDALLAAIGATVDWVDLFLDDGFVLAFRGGSEWRIPADTLARADDWVDAMVSGPGFWIDTADEPFVAWIPPES